jgi:hypothetical protein
MDVKSRQELGIPKFGITYRQNLGGEGSIVSVYDIEKLALFQRLRIKFRRLIRFLRGKYLNAQHRWRDWNRKWRN